MAALSMQTGSMQAGLAAAETRVAGIRPPRPDVVRPDAARPDAARQDFGRFDAAGDRRRPRFDLPDDAGLGPAAVSRRSGPAPAQDEAQAPSASASAPPARGNAGPGWRARSFSAFLAQAIGQAEGDGPDLAVDAGLAMAGNAAYRRHGAVRADSAGPGDSVSGEILSPFPVLASGRSLDLAV